jgi:hypothetical protein
MGSLLFGLPLVLGSTAMAADSSWYLYQFIAKNGYRWPSASKCVPCKPPAASIEHLHAQGADFQVIDRMTRKGKPVVVDILMPRYVEHGVIVNTGRFVKGKALCEQIREDDVSGKLEQRALQRYR